MLSLPINVYSQPILDTVADNSVVVVIGEAGSGKTTQIPQVIHSPSSRGRPVLEFCFQMLLKAGYGDKGWIGVTQPRRVVRCKLGCSNTSKNGDVVAVAVG